MIITSPVIPFSLDLRDWLARPYCMITYYLNGKWGVTESRVFGGTP